MTRTGSGGPSRGSVAPGARVAIVQKRDQGSGRTVEGVVAAVLTRSATHPHGIKVRLVDGRVGRVKAVLGEGPGAPDAVRPSPTGSDGGGRAEPRRQHR